MLSTPNFFDLLPPTVCEAANDIAAVRQHNSNLKTVDLSDNMLQVTGAKKINNTNSTRT